MRLEINGRNEVDGSVNISGAKNSVLPIIAASLLSKDKVIIRNVPHISDVHDMLEILNLFNVKYELNSHILKIDATDIIYSDIDSLYVGKIRASYYYMSVMLCLFKKCKMIECGGCNLGSRPIDYHLYAFKKMGCFINDDKLIYDISYIDLKNTNVLFRHKSVGATINTLILSMNTDYTIIINPSIEPEVLDVIGFLRLMGRSIFIYKGFLISTKGKKKEVLDYTIIPDRIEATTYMLIGALLGRVSVLNVNPKHLKAEIKVLRKIGAGVIVSKNKIYVYKRKINGVKLIAKEYPKLSTDTQPIFCALLSYADSSSIVCDKVFNNRFSILTELELMGLDVTYDDGYVTLLPNKMCGRTVYAHDLRCGAGLIVAAMGASGNTIIENCEVINRGYENIISKLIGIGTNIKLKN